MDQFNNFKDVELDIEVEKENTSQQVESDKKHVKNLNS